MNVGLGPAPAREADLDDHIRTLEVVRDGTPNEKKQALQNVAHTIIQTGNPPNLVQTAKDLKAKLTADNYNDSNIENDFTDFQNALENPPPEGGRRRRRRGKATKKPKRKARRYTRRR